MTKLPLRQYEKGTIMKRKLIAAFLCLFVLSSCRSVQSNVSADSTGENTAPVTTDRETEAESVPDTTVAETDPETTAPEDDYEIEKIQLDRYEVSLTVGKSEMPMVTMLPTSAANEYLGEIWESSNESVATVNKYGNITGVGEGECTVTVTSENNPNVKAEVKVTVKADASLTYIDGILIANKTYSLPSSYNPGVNPEANSALEKMINAAAEDGITLYIKSAFRSYATQQTLYNNYVARDGVAAADRYSARPGHSEHQTGLAFDLNSLEQSFGETPEGKWLATHCHEYGFIIRYPEDKESITGYMYEPWHVRYLGVEVAKKVYESGLCLEEYLGITSEYQD